MLKFKANQQANATLGSSLAREKFLKFISERKERKAEEEKKKNKTAIEKLESKYSLYEYDETSTDPNVIKLNAIYGKTTIFKAGEQKDIFSAEVKDQVLQQEAIIRATTIPRSKRLVNIEETNENTFITFGK